MLDGETEVIPGVGTEAGDAGGTGDGAADTRTVADAEQIAGAGAEAGAGEAEAGKEAGTGAEAATAGETEVEVDLYTKDGREVADAALKKAIIEIAKTDKAAARATRDAYFSNQAVLKEFPEAKSIGDVLREIRAAKNTIESLGGDQGITELQEEVTDYRNEIAQFASGDPKLIEELYEANPESTALMTANALAVLEGKDKKIFDNVILPALVKRLEEVGLNKYLVRIADFIKEGKGQEAYDAVAEVGKWLTDVNEAAKKAIDGRGKRDPRQDELDRRRQELDTQSKQLFERSIATEVNRRNNSSLSRVVEPLFKTLKLTPEGRREFINGLQSRIWAAMKADKTFQRQARGIMEKGDQDRAAQFIAQKFEELAPEMFRKHRNALYPNIGTGATKPGPAKPAGAGNGAAAGKPAGAATGAKVGYKPGTKPNREDVDWSKTSDTQWISGKGITLRDGRVINLNWSEV